ncbi:MAG: hypothetical protein ACXWXQ_10935 [Actinomycetota bacterium]
MGTATAFRLNPVLVAEVERVLPLALFGDERACRTYAQAWRRLVADLLEPYADAGTSAAGVLERLALTAPFAPDGPPGALVSVAAAIIPGMQVPTVTRRAPASPPEPSALARFTRLVLAELAGAGTGLEPLMASWRLSITDVARLFGVRRQAVQQWFEDGVPAARQPKLLAIFGIADLLERNLLPERIPAVVRTPSAADGGHSMLEAIAADRHQELLERTRRSFDWAWSA